jgi:cellulose synthase/poly-beta-1,6-N-acetylglucosamine synthase-like glycosyltransferase
MIKLLRQLNQSLERQTSKLFIIGLILVLFRNWRQWQHDKVLVAELQKEHQELPELSHTPKVSVLVAAWNEAHSLEAHLLSFLAIDYPDIELIVCAGGKDNTLKIAQKYEGGRIKVLAQVRGEGKQRALARCYKQSMGEIIYLTDADCLLNQKSFEKIIAPLINEDEYVTSGVRRPFIEQLQQPFINYQWAIIAYTEARSSDYSNGLYGANAALRRCIIEKTGRFEIAAPTGTDYILGQQVINCGNKIRFVPESFVETVFEKEFSKYVTQQRRWLLNLLVLGYRFKRPHHYYPAIVSICIGISIFSSGSASISALFLKKYHLALIPFRLFLFLQLFGLVSKMRYIEFCHLLYPDYSKKISVFKLLLYQNLDFLVWFLSGWYFLTHSIEKLKW